MCLNHPQTITPIQSVGKLSSAKLVPGTKNVGDAALEGTGTRPKHIGTILSKTFWCIFLSFRKFPHMHVLISILPETQGQKCADLQEFSLCVALSSPSFCPTNFSCLSLPGILVSFHLRSELDSSLSSPCLCHVLESLSRQQTWVVS